jgi:hypothetical protein
VLIERLGGNAKTPPQLAALLQEVPNNVHLLTVAVARLLNGRWIAKTEILPILAALQ